MAKGLWPKPLRSHVTVVYGIDYTTTSCGSHITCNHATNYHCGSPHHLYHIISTWSPRHADIMYGRIPIFFFQISIFFYFPKMLNVKIFSRDAMELEIKLDNDQFRHGAHRVNLCTQTSTLLCQFLDQFRPFLQDYTAISPNSTNYRPNTCLFRD
jgi:hypothetical protein